MWDKIFFSLVISSVVLYCLNYLGVENYIIQISQIEKRYYYTIIFIIFFIIPCLIQAKIKRTGKEE
jgi:membrane protein DedA with SNARE-associated domain